MKPYHNLVSIFKKYKEIKLVYLFGSQAINKTTPLSDYDFAVFFQENISKEREKDIVLELIAGLTFALKMNNVEIVVLNKPLSPLLKFNIVKEGRLLYQKEPYKILVEPAFYNEYFDFQIFKRIHNIL